MAGGITKTSMVMVAAVIIMIIKGIVAEILTVGDDNGWTIPASTDFYSSWAAKHSFVVGDTLVFKFSTGRHTVAMVTSKDAYDQCNFLDANPILIQGPAQITLNTVGEFFFFCTVGSHCGIGQKFAVNVTAAAGRPNPSPAPPPPASRSPTESPKKSSAPMAFTISTFSFLFMALAIALLF